MRHVLRLFFKFMSPCRDVNWFSVENIDLKLLCYVLEKAIRPCLFRLPACEHIIKNLKRCIGFELTFVDIRANHSVSKFL